LNHSGAAGRSSGGDKNEENILSFSAAIMAGRDFRMQQFLPPKLLDSGSGHLERNAKPRCAKSGLFNPDTTFPRKECFLNASL
jgi:hypothetical protein